MNEITVYLKEDCPDCARALKVLSDSKAPWYEHLIEDLKRQPALAKSLGWGGKAPFLVKTIRRGLHPGNFNLVITVEEPTDSALTQFIQAKELPDIGLVAVG